MSDATNAEMISALRGHLSHHQSLAEHHGQRALALAQMVERQAAEIAALKARLGDDAADEPDAGDG